MNRTVVPGRRITGRVCGLLVADRTGFETAPVETLSLDLDGILLDGPRPERHRGPVRKADARVPWYPRGTPIRNSRQVSIVSAEDLAAIVRGMDLPELPASWLGANIVIEGVPDLSMLPRGTRLTAPGLASLAIEDQNAPCRGPGKAIASRHPDRTGLDLQFVTVARRLRGLVAFVERAGTLGVGDAIDIRIPEQWIY